MLNLFLLGNLMLMWKKDDQIFLLQNKILSPNKRLTVDYDENGNTVSIFALSFLQPSDRQSRESISFTINGILDT